MASFDWSNPTVERVIARASAINRKITPQDCEVSKTLCDVALFYASNYEGSFSFMLDMRKVADKGWKLSPAQCSGILNSMMAEYKRNQAQAARDAQIKRMETEPLPFPDRAPTFAQMKRASAPEAPINPSAPIEPVCKSGTYTIVLDEAGAYRTLRLVDCPEHMGKPAGTQIAQYLSGSDNESNYTGFAFVSGSRFGIWAKFKADGKLTQALRILLAADREAQIEFGHAYAVESGNCFRCGRKLTVPASIHRGLGPKCAEML